MSVATIHVEQPTECHCCTSDKEVEICTLENCNYPLCKNCKKKAYKIDNRCPGCRRHIVINIKPCEVSFQDIIEEEETDSDSDSDSDMDVRFFKKCNCKCPNFNFNFYRSRGRARSRVTRRRYVVCSGDCCCCISETLANICGGSIGIFIISLVGRIVYMWLYNDINNGFFCERSSMPLLLYFGTSLIGLAFSTCFLCCFGCLFRLFCVRDEDVDFV